MVFWLLLAEECRHYEEVWKAYKEEGKSDKKVCFRLRGSQAVCLRICLNFWMQEYDVPTTDFEKTFLRRFVILHSTMN